MNYFAFILSTIIIFSLIFYFFINVYSVRKLNLYDFPKKGKIHKKKMPLSGGIYFISLIILIYFIQFFFLKVDRVENFYFITLSFSLFLIGFADDKLEIKPINRLLVLFICLIIFFSIKDTYHVEILKFIIFNKEKPIIFYKNFNDEILSAALLVTLITIINITDGLNGLILSIAIIVTGISLIYKFEFNSINILLLVGGLIFLVINLSNKAFLGSSGNIIISLLIYTNLQKVYNEISPFDILTVLIIFLFPSLDLVRLFIVRIINNSSPLSRDLNHLHYLIYNKYKNRYLPIYITLIFAPFFIHFFLIKNSIITICLGIIFYFFTIYSLKTNSK